MCLKAQNEASMKKSNRLEFDSQFADVKSIFKDSDYIVGNLETPICPSLPLTVHDIRFNSSVEYLKAVKNLNVGFVSLANNHVLDQGIAGLSETISCLERVDLDYSGAYKCIEDSDKIFVKDVGGVRLAIVCFTFGTNSQVNGVFLENEELWRVDLLNKQKKMLLHWDPNPNAVCEEYISDEISIAAVTNSKNIYFQRKIKEKIENAKKCSDIVIVMPHMGGQYNPHPGNYARWMMNYIRECGADIIIGGHPHVPQKCILQDGVLECYSLGNFACTPNVGWCLPNSFAEYGVALHTYIDESSKKLVRVTFSIVKNIVDEFGYTTIVPIVNLYDGATVVEKERLQIDSDEIISRVRGFNDNENRIDSEISMIL